jgi:hypothetical protein
MTQRALDCVGYKMRSSQSTQTVDHFSKDDLLVIRLENKKTARAYYSSVYKSNVLSLNFGSSKNFIFTKSMWREFSLHIKTIDKIFDH